MESSIAVFLLRQSACELLPTIFDPPKRNTWNTLLTLHLCISASEPKVLKLRSGIFLHSFALKRCQGISSTKNVMWCFNGEAVFELRP